MRGDSGVAGEGRVVGVPKFHSWGKCTMPLTNINSDWMSNASSGLRIIGASAASPTLVVKTENCLYIYVYISWRTVVYIMAYGSTPYVGMTPKKNGGHIQSAQMTRSKCPR